MNNTRTKTTNSLLPYSVIASASNGDIGAINIVLNHYSRYINSLSIKKLYDNSGNEYVCIDESLRHRIESKLISKILTFRA